MTWGQKYWVGKSNGGWRREGGSGDVGSYFRERLRLEDVYAKLWIVSLMHWHVIKADKHTLSK